MRWQVSWFAAMRPPDALLTFRRYMDRKNEIPEGKLPYYVLPIIHYYKGYLSTTFNDAYYVSTKTMCWRGYVCSLPHNSRIPHGACWGRRV